MNVVGVGHVWVLLILVLIVVGAVAVVLLVVRSSRPGQPLKLVDRRECPACREWMRRDASLCPHCRTPSEPWTFQDGRWWVQRADGWHYLDERSGAWQRPEQGGPPR